MPDLSDNSKLLLSLLATVLTLTGFIPYIWSILRQYSQPHVFSWVIWALSTCSIFFAQLQDGAGVGAWPIGISGLITTGIAILAYRQRGSLQLNHMDWVFFLLALIALLLWYVTSTPLWAVIILTLADILGFIPTFKKAYILPYSESLAFYNLFICRNLVVILALQHYSLTTVLFPLAIAIACLLFIVMVIYRRTTLQ